MNVLNKKVALKNIMKNLHMQMAYFVPYARAMELFSEDCLVLRTAVDDDTFNYVFQTQFTDENVRHKIDHVMALYKEKNLPFSWWVGPEDSPKNLKEILLSYGFLPKEFDHGMFLPLKNWKYSNKPLKLDIKRVVDAKGLQDFFSVYEKIGGTAGTFDAIFSSIPPHTYGEGMPYGFYVGYKDENCVVAGVSVVSDQVVGIYYIMTVPEERKQGFATEMMEHILLRAQAGECHMAVLQASEAGKHVYAKMGFCECGIFQEFCPQEFYSSTPGF